MKTVTLQLPVPLYRLASEVALEDGLSVDQVIVTAAKRYLAVRRAEAPLNERAGRGNSAAFRSVLSRVPASPPPRKDRLPGNAVSARSRTTSAKKRPLQG